MKLIRISKLVAFKKKVMRGFPSPFIIASSVVLRYKKGQSQERTFRKFPASVLLNNIVPIESAKIKKEMKQVIPRSVQYCIVLETTSLISFLLFLACMSATVGRSIEEIADVSAVGNSRHGSAIPVSTP